MTNEATTNDAAVDYQALLEQERASLESELIELGFGAPGATGLNYDSNFADTSQVTAERGEADALVKELRSALVDVEHAIEKFNGASYGTCERCEKPISPARLEAKPASRLCIECASSQR